MCVGISSLVKPAIQHRRPNKPCDRTGIECASQFRSSPIRAPEAARFHLLLRYIVDYLKHVTRADIDADTASAPPRPRQGAVMAVAVSIERTVGAAHSRRPGPTMIGGMRALPSLLTIATKRARGRA
jgi:hypothetical protein